jgi:hypothetical protein
MNSRKEVPVEEHQKNKEPLPLGPFLRHFSINFIFGTLVVLASLGFGMWGYHHFESMSWVDSYVNAAMILSGMGPVQNLVTEGGKIFAGTYALFSGIVFLVVIAIIFAPVVRRFIHKIHIESTQK